MSDPSGGAHGGAPPHLVIVAPFWGAPAHVGVYRVERFLRWARARGVRVTMVRAGSSDRVEHTSTGVEVVVADPIRFYRDQPPAGAPSGPPAPARRENRFRRSVATTLLSPDPGIAWAHRAATHPTVREHARGARWVLSSSPPESSHLCAWQLARGAGARLVADLRDGWLDDPLKPALRRYRLRRWHEGRWERRVVRDAACVFVTSAVWRDMLVARYPAAASRTVVLTNGYPPGVDGGDVAARGRAAGAARTAGRPLELLHAGRFTTSRATQTVGRLLEPLLAGVRRGSYRGRVRLLGDLGPDDKAAVEALRPAYAAAGWTVEHADRVARDEALAALDGADGLLLLSATPPTIPSKLFEYLPARRPVFAVTPAAGAVWQACAELPQVTLVAPDDPEAGAAAAARFLDDCARGPAAVRVPAGFAEPALAAVFASALGLPDGAPDARPHPGDVDASSAAREPASAARAGRR